MARLRGHALIIGAMKSGTTSLFRWLSSIPGITPSQRKDTKFFIHGSQGGNYSRGVEWYAAQFPQSADAVWRIEASTQYTKHPDYAGVPRRISHVLDSPKLIYIVRNPLERALSHVFHNLVVDGTVTDINACLECSDCKYTCYSDYALQVSQYLNHYALDRICIVEYLDRSSCARPLSALLRSLGLSPMRKSSSLLCLPQENTLAAIMDRRNTQSAFRYSKSNQRAFAKLTDTVSAGPYRNVVELALAFGLRAGILETIIARLKMLILEFEEVSGMKWDRWVAQNERYL